MINPKPPLPNNEKERLRRLAQNATPGPRVLTPRSCGCSDAISRGEDPIDVAAAHDGDDWCLGWELEGSTGFAAIRRGDFASKDAALIMATPPEVVLALLDEIDALKGISK